jgi:SAM-dependent methyltransferase
MNIRKHNAEAWDKAVENKSEWSRPVSSKIIAAARRGEWSVVLTPAKKVPREWFGDIKGKNILCLAGGGGQQAPVLAAAGANVTCFDNSAKQLAQDKFVAERDGLKIRLEQGDAADLSRFEDASFDLIFHPCSNCYFPKLEPVWQECFRVLRGGGVLLSGFMNPIFYMIDHQIENKKSNLFLKYALPFSDLKSLSEKERENLIASGEPMEFGHTLTEQIGGQTKAGFLIADFYEDHWSKSASVLNQLTPLLMATKAVKS